MDLLGKNGSVYWCNPSNVIEDTEITSFMINNPKAGIKKADPVVPLAQKELLTLREAAAYTGIGINRLRRMSNDENCSFVLWVGSKRMLKRRELEKYLAEAYSV